MITAEEYRKLNKELATLLEDIKDGELDVDMVMKKYERGQEIIAKLQDYLENAENKLIKGDKPVG